LKEVEKEQEAEEDPFRYDLPADYTPYDALPEYSAPKPKARFDAQTVISTYSNTEHHPRLLADGVSLASRFTGAGARVLDVPDETAEVAAGEAEDDRKSVVSAATPAALANKRVLISSYGAVPIKLSKKTGLPLFRQGPAAHESTKGAQVSADGADEGSSSDGGDESDEEDGASYPVLPSARPRDETPEERRLRKAAVKLERRDRRAAKKSLKVAYVEEEKKQRELLANKKANEAFLHGSTSL
jgi:protein LTV1